MAKKPQSNKYGMAGMSFNQPGFSLATPKVSLVSSKEEKTADPTTKKTTKKVSTATPKNNPRVSTQKTHNKVIARKPTMMKKAGRSK